MTNKTVNLGALLLSQPTVNLTGTLPVGGQVKLTAVPEDTWLRPSHIDGDQVTPMALNWTVQEAGGQYVVRGIVPGTYTAAVTTARRERDGKPSTTGGNIAATHSTVVVNGPAPTAAFTAPAGATARGELRYDRGNRPVIAPFGFRIPTPATSPGCSRPSRTGRSTAGRSRSSGCTPARSGGRLLDLEALYGEHPDVLIPDNLVSSARNETGTPYWYTARKQGITLTEGATVDLGVIKIKIHGVIGVRAVINGGG